LLRTEV